MRLLFITSNRIGDAILSTGLLDWLTRRYPGIRVTVACGPAAAGIFEAVPGLERIIPMPKQPFAGHWFDLWKKTVLTHWRFVIDLRGSLLPQFLIARRRRSLQPTSHRRIHRVKELAGRAGLPEVPAPKIWLADHHKAAAKKLLPGTIPILALGPTANWGGKVWPPERFAALAKRLVAPGAPLAGARVAIFGGPGEEALSRLVAEALAGLEVTDLTGQLDLLTTAACLARAAFFVGNDSGLMHMAAAVGTPTLGLFGPSRETIYGPYGNHTAAVRTDLSYEEITSAPGYDYRSHESRMTTLSIDKAEGAALALLEDIRENSESLA